MKNDIRLSLMDPALTEIVVTADDALNTVAEKLNNGSGEDGTVTIKVSMKRNSFKDGYGELRFGVNLSYSVVSSVQQKNTHNANIPTGQMMLELSEYEGWKLVPAPDPQMTF